MEFDLPRRVLIVWMAAASGSVVRMVVTGCGNSSELKPALLTASNVRDLARSDHVAGTVTTNVIGIVRQRVFPYFWSKFLIKCALTCARKSVITSSGCLFAFYEEVAISRLIFVASPAWLGSS
jgi:hypothetical protein